MRRKIVNLEHLKTVIEWILERLIEGFRGIGVMEMDEEKGKGEKMGNGFGGEKMRKE
jgi:hypothetical protein